MASRPPRTRVHHGRPAAGFVVLLAALLSACAGSFPSEPIPAPVLRPPPPPVSLTGLSLINQCHAALPRAHPWRARQLKSALLRYQFSRSYYAAAPRMTPKELSRAAAQEREAYDLLLETCRPLLIRAVAEGPLPG